MNNLGKIAGVLNTETTNIVSVAYNPLTEKYDFCLGGYIKSATMQVFELSLGVKEVPYESLIEMYLKPDASSEGVSRKQRTTSNPPKNLEELIKPIHTILLDMDEVLVNFKQILIDCNPHYDVENMYEIAAVFGDKEALISEWISNAIKKKGFEYAKPLWFYHTVMDKLLPYWTEKGINVEILSSLSSNPANQTYIGTQKLRWLSNNNCHLKFTFVKGARNKQNHAKPGVLLIDDYYRNVTQFIKAGGYAILANPKDQESSIYNKLRLLGLTPD